MLYTLLYSRRTVTEAAIQVCSIWYHSYYDHRQKSKFILDRQFVLWCYAVFLLFKIGPQKLIYFTFHIVCQYDLFSHDSTNSKTEI